MSTNLRIMLIRIICNGRIIRGQVSNYNVLFICNIINGYTCQQTYFCQQHLKAKNLINRKPIGCVFTSQTKRHILLRICLLWCNLGFNFISRFLSNNCCYEKTYIYISLSYSNHLSYHSLLLVVPGTDHR
jgi:hypothetical protein